MVERTRPLELPDVVHHLVDARNWPSVRRTGLRTAASLARSCLPADDADELLRRRRPVAHELPSGAILRDQSPMPEAALERCLVDGLTPADWYETINGAVYFWVDPGRMTRHLVAQRGPQLAIAFDGPALARAYADRAFVTAFNVGSALRRPARRGRGSFVPYDAWRARGWADEAPSPGTPRRRTRPPAELVIRSDVPDALRFARRVSEVGSCA